MATGDQPRFCDVVIPRTKLDELTYGFDPDVVGPLAAGDCVEVPLRGKPVKGVVVAVRDRSPVARVQPVGRMVRRGMVGPGLRALAGWLADYYCCLRGEAYNTLLPAGILGYRPRKPVPGLTPAQAGTPPVDTVLEPGAYGEFGVWVAMRGPDRFRVAADFVTDALARGSVLVLMPEADIAEGVRVLRETFGQGVVQVEAAAGRTARRRQWLAFADADGPVVVTGTRAAVFAPVRRVGGIVVLDGHAVGFKEERYPRYNARDLAIVRARAAGCPVLLCGPTPSVETWANVRSGAYRLLGEPATPERLADSFVVDMGRHFGERFSPRLARDLESVAKDGVAVLYVNRRGLSRHVRCRECGHVLVCDDCLLPMVLQPGGELVCGFCGTRKPAPESCPECEGTGFDLRAPGVDLIAREVERMFPGRVVEKVTRESSGFPDCVDGTVVVGTRAMLSVPWPDRVGLVAAVEFDYELVRPDFRARERAFQVLSELGARAVKARLVVQVRRPDDPAVEYAFEQDPVGFLDVELESRREAGFPPWRRLAIVEVHGPTRGSVLNHARRVFKCLQAVRGVEMVGPVDVARGGVRFLVKYPRGRKFGAILDRALLRRGKAETRVDVDPYETT